ncbi:MAG: citrate/2-methylcitrate synthase, partial [Candidatus Latescibacterota bacterium]
MSESLDKNVSGKSNGPEVIRGLEGVVAAETDISYVDGVNGDLYYKGYNIHDLADVCTFMEVAYLLLNGELPTVSQLRSFRHQTV